MASRAALAGGALLAALRSSAPSARSLCSVHAGYLTGQNILIDGGPHPGRSDEGPVLPLRASAGPQEILAPRRHHDPGDDERERRAVVPVRQLAEHTADSSAANTGVRLAKNAASAGAAGAMPRPQQR